MSLQLVFNDFSIARSPLFYVGDKYRLVPQLLEFFPNEINNFHEPFVGGGSVFLNVKAKSYYLNDINKHLIAIHKFLKKSAEEPKKFYTKLESIIYKYNLSHSYKKNIVPEFLKIKFKKTYYARFNKTGYEKLRADVNLQENNDPLLYFILLIYGFNRMLRFNQEGKFNLPVGNVDLNKNVIRALENYFILIKNRKVTFMNIDFREFLMENTYQKNDFVYLDPPYLITLSEYNKLWNQSNERDLLSMLDELNKQQVKFALSNVVLYRGKKNVVLSEWVQKYNCFPVQSNYISYHDNKQKLLREILVTNY